MWRKLAVFLALVGSVISLPARAFAQGWGPRAEDWFGPWAMWSGGWSSWWWICPLMMIAMMAVMMFVCRFFMGCCRHRD
jgi:hypothetical protein